MTERPLALGAMVTFKTTEFYLVAKGDLLAVSQPLPSTKTTDPEPEPEQKRQRVGQQLGVGELPLTTGERAPIHITDLEGVKRARYVWLTPSC